MVESYLETNYFPNPHVYYANFYVHSIVTILQSFFLFLAFALAYIFGGYKRTVLAVWALLIHIPIALDAFSVYFTGYLLNGNFLLTIFDSNYSEAIYCLSNYWLYIALNLILIVVMFCIKIPRSFHSYCLRKFGDKKLQKRYKIYCWLLLIFALIKFDEYPMHCIVCHYDRYLNDIEELKKYNSKSNFHLSGIKSDADTQTCVIVIGESVDRKHMSVYGYERVTTPYFSELASKNKLLIFKDVITANTMTAIAVPDIFHIDIDKKEKAPNQGIYSLLHFFKDAQFKTFWISNQNGEDRLDNTVTRLGMCCDSFDFLSNSEMNKLDEVLLQPFEKALNDKSKKKLIVLHLIGSHTPIDRRYPRSFSKYKTPKKYYDKQKAEGTAMYDNSILYTDYLVNEIIKKLEKQDGYATMLYLSDHGQSIYDTKECLLGTRRWPDGYEVPFVIWMSDKYKQKNEGFIKTWNVNSSYVTDKTAYTIIELARLSHPALTDQIRQGSIFSPDSAKIAASRQEEIQKHS